jgi:hypothetical protein
MRVPQKYKVTVSIFSLIVSLFFGLHTSLLALQWVRLPENMPIDLLDRHLGPG